MAFTIQPQFRDLIPPPTPEERAALKASIEADKIRDPITLWETGRVVLDGHTRIEIHRELGRGDDEIPERIMRFDTADDAMAWMIENQCGRRNLSASQRAMLAERLATLKRGRAESNAQICASTQSTAAATMGVSRRLVQTARKVAEEAAPEVVAAVKAGEMSLNAAVKTLAPEPAPAPEPVKPENEESCWLVSLPPMDWEFFGNRETVMRNVIKKLTAMPMDIALKATYARKS